MASQDLLPDVNGILEPQFRTEPTTANLVRGMYANGSNARVTKEQCEGIGLGYTYGERYGMPQCYFPCPDAYTIASGDYSKCEPRPILTKVAIYYGILAKAVQDCAELIPAYKEAVAEANNDPTQIGFPANSGCVNPFDPPNPPPADDGVFDPSASNGDPLKPADAPPMTDPNGSSGQAGQQNGGIDAGTGAPFIPTMPDGTTQQPYVPPPPEQYRDIDESDSSGMSKSLPRDRLLITDEEIDQLPKVNDFGAMVEGDLALRLRAHPTLLDVTPEYLLEFQRLVPSFVYECSVTQEEFDLLPEDWKCKLCENYVSTIYDNPRNITYLRQYAPTITLTRNAPSTPPSFKGCPAETKRIACESKTGYGGGACGYSGGCNGECVCPQPPVETPTSPAPDSSSQQIAVAVGIVALLGVGYYVMKS